MSGSVKLVLQDDLPNWAYIDSELREMAELAVKFDAEGRWVNEEDDQNLYDAILKEDEPDELDDFILSTL